MGREAKGWIQVRGGKFIPRLRGENLGSFNTHVEAQRFLNAALREDAGIAPDNFADFGAEWMDMRELDARRRKRMRSFKKERSSWNAHVKTAKFWNYPIRRITPKVVQEWIGEMFEKEALQTTRSGSRGTKQAKAGRLVSRTVVVQALKKVKLCLDHAVIQGKLKENPARLVKLPRDEPDEHDGELIVHLSLAEIDALFKLPLPSLQRAVFAVAIYGGLRADELWGLRWQDIVGLDGGARPTLRIRRSYDGPVKTKNATRDVPLLPPAFEALKAYRATLSPLPIAGLVFPGDGGCHRESYNAGWRDKPYRTADGKRKTTLGWRSKAGIRDVVNFKDLRHTCGCHLAQGSWTRPFTLLEIKRWLGHSTIAVTERHYATLTSDNLHAAVEDLPFAGNKRGDSNDHR